VRRKRAVPRISPKDEKEDQMKYLFAAVMLASAVVGFSEAASAAEGCGPGWYRGRYGNCRPMGGRPPVVVVAPRPAPVVVVRPRGCPYGLRWYAGRCRPF
jgi:hypothetical protein